MAEDIPTTVRKICYERDGYRCRWCGRMDVGIDLHHVVYRSSGGRHVPENLISLCREHHNLAHSSKDQYQEILLDVLAQDQKVTVNQVMRWRDTEMARQAWKFVRDNNIKPTPLSTGEPEGRVRRMLDLG